MSFLSKSCKLFGAYSNIFTKSAIKSGKIENILLEINCKNKTKSQGGTFRLREI